jgi:hypothetical protein
LLIPRLPVFAEEWRNILEWTRLIWIVAAILPPFPAIIAYLVAWLIVPLAPPPVPAASQPSSTGAPNMAQPV